MFIRAHDRKAVLTFKVEHIFYHSLCCMWCPQYSFWLCFGTKMLSRRTSLRAKKYIQWAYISWGPDHLAFLCFNRERLKSWYSRLKSQDLSFPTTSHFAVTLLGSYILPKDLRVSRKQIFYKCTMDISPLCKASLILHCLYTRLEEFP